MAARELAMRDITPLIAPRSIAVIGASSNPTKSGGVLFDNLAKGNFTARSTRSIAPRAEIMGHKAYPTLADVPEKVDLVYIVLPQQHVEDAVKQCVAAGARAACIITAGFSEASEKGRADEERLRKIAHESGLLLAGPNTIGMVNAEVGMMGSFVNFPRWETGGVSFFTQTGIFTGAVMLNVMSAETSACRWEKHRRRQQDRRRRSRFSALRRRRPGDQGRRLIYREHPRSARVSGKRARGAQAASRS